MLDDGDDGDGALGHRAEAKAGAPETDHRLGAAGAREHPLLVQRRPGRVRALAVGNDGAAASTCTRPDDLEIKGNCKI